jgi:alginate O-acetyltransferase complex protein AlgJ
MEFERLAAVERELITRNVGLHPHRYQRHPETLSPSGVVIAGYAGHLFIADGGNMWEQQILGQRRLAPDALQRWSSLLAARAVRARQSGVRMVHLIVPEKQMALPSFRWKTDMAPDPAGRPLVQILASAPADVEIIYPLALFDAHQAECELYWRGNSHWCASGCILAARAVIGALRGGEAFAADRFLLERATIPHDLTAHFPDDLGFEEVIRIRPAGRRVMDNLAFQRTGHYSGSHYIVRNPDAPVAETLVIFGDSYACDLGLTAALTACFAEVHFVWSKQIAWPYVAQTQARHVVWQSAERFLITPPPED